MLTVHKIVLCPYHFVSAGRCEVRCLYTECNTYRLAFLCNSNPKSGFLQPGSTDCQFDIVDNGSTVTKTIPQEYLRCCANPGCTSEMVKQPEKNRCGCPKDYTPFNWEKEYCCRNEVRIRNNPAQEGQWIGRTGYCAEMRPE